MSLNIGYGLMDPKKRKNIAGSYGCSSPISTVQQILTEDEKCFHGCLRHFFRLLHSLHLVSMSLELYYWVVLLTIGVITIGYIIIGSNDNFPQYHWTPQQMP